MFGPLGGKGIIRSRTWTPARATTSGGVRPVHWYDASQIQGLVNNDPVAAWADSSVNGDGIAQADPTKRPLFIMNVLNGKPVVRFDGSNDFMNGFFTVGGALSQPVTMWAVAQLHAPQVLDGLTHDMIEGYQVDALPSTRISFCQTASGAGKWAMFAGTNLNGSASNGNWNIWMGLFNGVSSRFWLNGIANSAVGNAGTSNAEGITIGSNIGGATFKWDGDIPEVIIYDPNLSTPDINQVGQYLAAKYGLSWTNLP